MSVDDASYELLSVVLKRRDVIDRLHEHPATKRTLTESLDCSRSTVDRALRELETHGLVTYTDGRFELTPLGEQAIVGTIELLEGIEVARDLEPVLEHLPLERFDLDLRLLADADVYVPEPGNPWAMVNQHVTVLEQADEIRAVLPLTGLHATEAVHERVIDHGARAELVGCPEVVRTFRTDPDFVTLIEEMEATGRHRMFQVNEQPPYFVGIIDDVVQIGVDEDGEPRAIVESTDPDVRAWAERTYERFKERAVRVDLDEVDASVDESTVK